MAARKRSTETEACLNAQEFTKALSDLTVQYRASIALEQLATPTKTKAKLKDIAERAESLLRDARALLELLSSLDERTSAALNADVRRLVRGRVRGRPARAIVSLAMEWLSEPDMHHLAEIAMAAHKRYTSRRGKFKLRQPYAAGEAVRALCERFHLPYARTVKRDVGSESLAVQVYRAVTGIQTERVEQYLP